jgi:hypothetical protein
MFRGFNEGMRASRLTSSELEGHCSRSSFIFLNKDAGIHPYERAAAGSVSLLKISSLSSCRQDYI